MPLVPCSFVVVLRLSHITKTRRPRDGTNVVSRRSHSGTEKTQMTAPDAAPRSGGSGTRDARASAHWAFRIMRFAFQCPALSDTPRAPRAHAVATSAAP